MKKAKTIIVSLIVMLASIFVSACSCGDSSVPQIYVKDIDIRCLTSTDTVHGTVDENSGILTITCHVKDVFKIEYTLTPEDATVTHVLWEFSKMGYVTPVNPGDYSRYKSTTETVEFVANAKGETALTFIANIVNNSSEPTAKKVTCNITVFEEKSLLPSFVEPTNIDFDNEKSILTWNPVKQIVTAKGATTNAELSDGIAKYLTGYEIVKTEIESGETTTDIVPANITKYDKFESGVAYNVSVRAIGDSHHIKSGDYSDSFRFYKLNDVTELTNDNGLISFVTPAKSSNCRVYYYGVDGEEYVERGTTENTRLDIGYTSFSVDNGDMYSIEVVSYPNYFNSEKGYAERDGVRYYPSTPKSKLVVQKLTKPTISLIDARKAVTIDGVTFTDINELLQPHASTMIALSLGDIVYETQYNQSFRYKITGGDIASPESKETKDLKLSLDALTAGYTYTITVEAIGDPSKTIESPSETLTFNIVSHLSEENITLNDDIILNSSTIKTGGIELFFVYQNSNVDKKTACSKRVELTSTSDQGDYDISKISLTAGTYKLFGKNIPLINETNKNAVVAPTTYAELMTFDVAEKVQNTAISNTNILSFSSVNGVTAYKVIVGEYDSDNLPFTVEVYAPLNSGDPDDGNVHYTIENGTISIDLLEVFKSFLKDIDIVTSAENPTQKLEEVLNLYLDSSKTFTCSVQAKGYIDGDKTVISSSPTNPIIFYKSAPVQNVTLDNYVISFDRVGTSTKQNYVIGLNILDPNTKETINSYTFTHRGMWIIDDKTDRVVTNLKADEICSVNSVNKTFAELIDPSKLNYITISALGYNGSETSDAVLNSAPCNIMYDITNQPTNVTLNQDSELSWKTQLLSNLDIVNYNYTIKFYRVTFDGDTEVLEPLASDTRTVSANVVTYEDIEKDGNSYTVYTLKANIGDILAKYADTVVAITIEENNAGMYTGYASSKFYATRISAPELQYAVDGSKQVISWNAINNADSYNISVTKSGDEDFTYTNDGGTSTYFSITDRITNDAWTTGTYTISVIASSEFSGSSTAKAPYVLTSVASYKTVYIVNGSLDVSVKGNTITWNNISLDPEIRAEYSISYTTSDGGTGIITDNDTLVYSADYTKITLDVPMLTAGINTVTIAPTIDFVKTGYIIIGNPKTNSVTKWQKADTLATTNGNLTFKVYGATDADITSLDIDLYQKKGDNFDKVSRDNYTVLTPVPVTTESTPYVSFTVVLDGLDAGELTLAVIVKSEGKLNSDLSDPVTGTKISAVADLEKSGDLLTWSSQPGISSYELGYKHRNDSEYSILTLRVEEQTDNIYKTFILKEDTTDEYVEDTLKTTFYYENGKFYYNFDYSLFIADETGDFLFTIRPLTTVDSYFSGNTSAPVVITKLNNATEITISSGKVNIANYVSDGGATPSEYVVTVYLLKTSIETVDGVESTKVQRATDTDGKEIKVVINGGYSINENTPNIAPIDLNNLKYNDISFADAGDYEIELMYIGNGNEIISSEFNTIQFNKLDVENMSTKDGQVVWANADGAENYTLEINDGTATTLFTIQAGSDETILTEDQLTYVTTDTDSEVAPVADTLFILQPGQVYELRIKANSGDKLHSKWSEVFKVKKLYAPTEVAVSRNTEKFTMKQEVTTEIDGEQITTTEDVEVLTGAPIVTWANQNKTNQVLKYQLKYSDDMLVNIGERDLLKYALNRELPVGQYALQLRIIGNTSAGTSTIGLLSSNYSTATALNYVAEVSEPKVSSGLITWDNIDGAFSYKVSAYSESDNTTPVFVVHTTTNSINFARFSSLVDLDSYNGNFTFVVNAITEPKNSIVSLVEDTNNAVSIFKPNVLENFKVKNGMLNWQVKISDVVSFVEAWGTDALKVEDTENPSLEVISYVVKKINNNMGENTALEEQISHLLKVRLNINNVEIIDTPTSVSVVKLVDGNLQEISSESEYLNATYLEFSYNVGIDPEIDNDVDSGEDTDNENSGDVEPQTIASPSESGIEYVAGKYVMKISALGNSDSDTPVVNGGYTTTITAYKPTTPKTWSSNGSDISLGKVQWGLSTTPNSTLEEFSYLNNYKITAVPVEGEGIKYTTVSVNSAYGQELGKAEIENSQNIVYLQNKYQYYRNLKNDLFVTTQNGENDNNVLEYNRFYRLLINSIGTEDSANLSDGELIYLNSNACVVGAPANILGITANCKVKNSNTTWNTGYGSTMTRLFIYGPFNNLNTAGTARDEDWVNVWNGDKQFELINLAYAGKLDEFLAQGTTLTEQDFENYAKLLTIIDIGEVDGARINEYTLTDAIYNNSTFPAGGYIFKFQDIGDGKGVVDSDISSGLAVEKLATPTMQSTGWVGVDGSDVYVWNGNNDSWAPQDYGNKNVGTFVWNPVIGANAYKVELYRLREGDAKAELLLTEHTRETRYDLPNGEAYNESNCKYFVRLVALRTQADNITQLADNFFSSDFVDTTAHYRLAIPSDLTIYGDGKIEWNNGTTPDKVSSYLVQFNYGMNETETKDAYGLSSNVPEFNLGEGNQNGTIAIAVKAVAVSVGGENAHLNSSYCTPVEVTRLADPEVRLEDGVFNWGTGSDPLTASELTIDTNTPEIISVESAITKYAYFTDIVSHTGAYSAQADTRKYPVGEHTFRVRFQGTGGDKGSTMTGGEDFYIASNQMSLTATKLATPVIENVTLNLASSSENMVKWEHISNAVGYRVRIFYSNRDTEYSTIDFSMETLLGNNEQSEYYAVTDSGTTTVYFKLNNIIDTSGLKQTGGSLYIYVQALGSGIEGNSATPELSDGTQTNVLYLSSSYSNHTTIGIPPQPSDLQYNTETGIVSWKVDSPDAFGVKLVNTYAVNNVSSEDFANYWKISANYLGSKGGAINENNATYKPYEELISRTVVYTLNNPGSGAETITTYNLEVQDILYLKTREVKNSDDEVIGYTTPNNYKLTTIGTNYKFGITAISFAENNEENSEFASPTVEFGGNFLFDRFGKGDGSEKYPYTVQDYVQLDRIRMFTDRHFELTKDISLLDSSSDTQNEWTPVTEEFSGSINGNGHTISNFELASVGVDGIAVMAMFVTNSGTISDLNVSVNIVSDTEPHTGLNVATIAITNNGTISNVSVSGTINVSAGQISYGTLVGGLVIDNYGTIKGSSVSAEITALDNSTTTVYAGGIAVRNYNSILGSNFAGSIRSNYVGGVTANNFGIIDRCYVDNANIYVTDTSTNGKYRKGATAGGISGESKVSTLAKVSTVGITNSYSKAYIYASKGASNYTMQIGGLVGSITGNITITNNYVVARLGRENDISTNGLLVYNMIEKTSTESGTLKDNYYIVETLENNLPISTASRDDESVTKKESLADLKSALANLKDENGNTVYSIPTGDNEYPTLA